MATKVDNEKVREIINMHADGKLSQEDANKQLEAAGSSVRINEMKNVISEEEKAATSTDGTPKGTTGWGFMNHGIGSPEKMYVKDGKFEYDTGFDLDMNVVMTINGVKFRVDRDKLATY